LHSAETSRVAQNQETVWDLTRPWIQFLHGPSWYKKLGCTSCTKISSRKWAFAVWSWLDDRFPCLSRRLDCIEVGPKTMDMQVHRNTFPVDLVAMGLQWSAHAVATDQNPTSVWVVTCK
jgi:hypothetical protein